MSDGKHSKKAEEDGQGDYEHDRTKDVRESGGGRHDKDDRGDK